MSCKYLQRDVVESTCLASFIMNDDLQQAIGWKLDEARAWLEAQHGANYDLQIVETAPPAKPPRRENASNKKAKTREVQTEVAKSRERAGDWRVLRCRYLGQNETKSQAASNCERRAAIEIVTAREIVKSE